MANHLVSGLLVPDSLAGHPALEIANTRAGWGTPAPREYLVSYDALAVWAADVGLLTAVECEDARARAAGARGAGGRVVHATQAFRQAYYGVLTDDEPSGADLDVVAVASARAHTVSRLVIGPGDVVAPDGGDIDRAGLALPLHRVALAGAALLAAGDRAFVRACGGRGCGWLFLDRAGRRRWCTMAICGNRAKARAHAARHRGDRRVEAPRSSVDGRRVVGNVLGPPRSEPLRGTVTR